MCILIGSFPHEDKTVWAKHSFSLLSAMICLYALNSIFFNINNTTHGTAVRVNARSKAHHNTERLSIYLSLSLNL